MKNRTLQDLDFSEIEKRVVAYLKDHPEIKPFPNGSWPLAYGVLIYADKTGSVS